MDKGQVVSFEMLMITTIMLVIMGLILPNLVSVKKLVTEGESRQLAVKYLNSLANRAEMIYVMGENAVMYEFVHAPSQIKVSGGGNKISISTGDFSETRNVSARLSDFNFNVSGDMRIRLEVTRREVNLSSCP